MTSPVTEAPFSRALDVISECSRTCSWCADQDMRTADAAMVECVRLCLDCAAVCATTIDLVARASTFYREYCHLSAEICDACAAECEKHLHHEHCRLAAEWCRRCADECRQLAT